MAAVPITEVFANNAQGIVTAGGNDAPGSGTPETLTVNVSAAFAVASTSISPQPYFFGADPAAPSEMFLVTVCPGGTGVQTWTVTRGADNSTPVTHGANFTIIQVVTHNSLANLQSPVTTGLQFVTGGGTITQAMVTAAQNAGCTGLYLDARCSWSFAASYQIKDTSNFIFESRQVGSVGYLGQVLYSTGCTTAAGADGIQIYSDGTTPTQGIILRGLVIVGANPNGVVHMGGRVRNCRLESCFIYNNANVSTTTSAGVTLSGAFTLSVTSTTPFSVSGGQALVAITNAGVPGVALITYTGISGSTLTGCSVPTGWSGTVANGAIVAPPQWAFVNDTALTNINSEDNCLRDCALASAAGAALGWGANDQTQHCNDTLLDNVCTATTGGLASAVFVNGGGINCLNLYDRSPSGSSPLATIVNFSATLILKGGEDQNNSSNTTNGVAQLVCGSKATTIIESRNLSIGSGSPTNNNTAYVTAGTLIARGMCRWSGTITIASTGTLDISDPSGNFNTTAGQLLISGSSGFLVANSTYPSGSLPSLASWTGPTSYVGSGALLCAPAQYAPATITILTASTTSFAAFSTSNVTTGAFTAPLSGSVIVTASFIATSSAAANFFAAALANHGTTTIVGFADEFQFSSAGYASRITIPFLITGLTPGTSYQFDLMGEATSTDTWSILAIGTTAPTLATGSRGGPVLLTVHAV